MELQEMRHAIDYDGYW